jgi:hypothetical protein
MATDTVTAPEQAGKARYAAFGLIGVVVTVIAVGLFFFLSRPPQMGTSEDVFNTVDALYTAVRSRDEKQLTACEQRLTGYREAGKLPAAAAESLAGIIRKARGGSWDTAAERLYEFMLAQRRDGVIDERPKAKPAKRK